MKNFDIDDLHITIDKEGSNTYSKVSYPQRYGCFSEIRTPEHVFQFNLKGEVKFIKGRGRDWPDPSEWLKRTITNDWVYYSTGGYDGPFDCFGEYYLPCLSYPSNAINASDPFSDSAVVSAINAWNGLNKRLTELKERSLPKGLKEFIRLVTANPPEEVRGRAERLKEILGDRITVLPPDARHADYDVIPVIIADGCLYKCGFCRVKSHMDFRERSKDNIKRQLKAIRDFFGHDISNYNSLFMGQHDALNSSPELIEFAARHAFDTLDMKSSYLEGSNLFFFGSVDSIINSDYDVFERISRLPFTTYINVGIESADQGTLHMLGKGITSESVERAFKKIAEINRRYEKIEVTSNFVFGDTLPERHITSFFRLMEKTFSRPFHKGVVYFSPLITGRNADLKRGIKREFLRLKTKIPVPAFLYLIQRL